MARLTEERAKEILANERYSFFHKNAELLRQNNKAAKTISGGDAKESIKALLTNKPQEINMPMLDEIFGCVGYWSMPALIQLRLDPEVRYNYDESISVKYKPKRFYKGTVKQKVEDAKYERQFDFAVIKDKETKKLTGTPEEDYFRATFKEFINEKLIRDYYILGLIAEKYIVTKVRKSASSLDQVEKWKTVDEGLLINYLGISKPELKYYINLLVKNNILHRSLMKSNDYWLTLSYKAQDEVKKVIEEQKKQGFTESTATVSREDKELISVEDLQNNNDDMISAAMLLNRLLLNNKNLIETAEKRNEAYKKDKQRFEDREERIIELEEENKKLQTATADLKFKNEEIKKYKEEIATTTRNMRRTLEALLQDYIYKKRPMTTDEFLDEFSEALDTFSDKFKNILPTNFEK